jgi:MtN3 and saliva related transmembrane protein
MRKTRVSAIRLSLAFLFQFVLLEQSETARLPSDPIWHSPAKMKRGDLHHMLAPQSIELLGSIAGFCTTFAFVPQLIKIQKQGGRDLSYGMLIFYLSGVLLWLAYGIFLRAPSVILANAATSLLIVLAIILKAWKERRPPAIALTAEQLPDRT